MKTITGVVLASVIFAIVIVTIVLFRIPIHNRLESYFHRQPKKVFSEEETNRFMHELFTKAYQETAELLAAKYNADEGKVLEMLAEDNVNSDKKHTKEKIHNYSKKYGLPQNIIASILWDLKVLESAEQRCE